MITVDEIMTTELETLPETANLESALDLMTTRHIHHILVVDGDGNLVGIVTHRDVLAASDSTIRGKGRQKNMRSVALSDIMVRDVSTIDEHASVRSAALYLEQHDYGCLPVVTDGKLRGIVTNSDFVAVAINLLEQLEANEPQDEFEEPSELEDVEEL